VTTATDRRAALDAMEDLVDRFLVPAADLLVADDDDPDIHYFDVDGIAGVPIHGLALGLLARDFPEPVPPPDDATLAARLDDRGIEIPDAERRREFFRAWTARRASGAVADLAGTVAGAAVPEDAAERAWTLQRLKAVRDAPLASIDRLALTAAVRAYER
jgi:hypothetical protein